MDSNLFNNPNSNFLKKIIYFLHFGQSDLPVKASPHFLTLSVGHSTSSFL